MRVFRAIVQVSAGLVFDVTQKRTSGHASLRRPSVIRRLGVCGRSFSKRRKKRLAAAPSRALLHQMSGATPF
jgi:hypothetical protein